MLYVPMSVRPSAIEGLGLFAETPIPAGTLVWRFVPWFDALVSDEVLLTFPENAKTFIGTHGYLSRFTPGGHIVCADLAKFMNHSSDHANIMERAEGMFAVRDIAAWEEIFCDYRDFCREGDTFYGTDFCEQTPSSTS